MRTVWVLILIIGILELIIIIRVCFLTTDYYCLHQEFNEAYYIHHSLLPCARTFYK
jgi:hypothetical protein